MLGFSVWRTWEKAQKAQEIADSIIENFDNKDIYKEFSQEYFPKEQTQYISQFSQYLHEDCDWKNRDGKFVDFYTKKIIGGASITGFIYEYYLKCDSLRFILHMNMDNQPELAEITIEPLEYENPLIIFPEKQLKYRKRKFPLKIQ